MPKRVASDSGAQRGAETKMIPWLAQELGVPLAKRTIAIGDVHVEVDGCYEDQHRLIAVEAYARVGRLKGSQPDKVLSDVLKLVFLKQACATNLGKTFEAHYVFASNEAAKCLQNRSWGGAAAVQLLGIKVWIAALDERTLAQIRDAQSVQDIRSRVVRGR